MNKIKVAALTSGISVPSARFRVRQVIPELKKHGIEVQEYIPPIPKYPPSDRWLRPIWGPAALAVRIPQVLSTHRHDVTLLQKELISTFTTFEALTKEPRILDIDDAIFLRREGRHVEKLVKMCQLVICGNNFLAENISKWSNNVRVIPTSIDTARYTPINANVVNRKKIIGWIGTAANLRYLEQIEQPLSRILQDNHDVKLRIICDVEPRFHSIDINRIEFIRWSEEMEIPSIQEMSVGIMPLADTDWERGKCSFKMLQYMACGVPVVVSPVGMNSELLEMGQIGFGPLDQSEWIDSLQFLLDDPVEARRLGLTGRKIVEEKFSTRIIARDIAKCIISVKS